jgi:hypothetical protein
MGWMAGFLARARGFSLLSSVQTGSGGYPTFYPVGRGDSFPGGWAARVMKLTTHLYLVLRSRMVELYGSSLIHLSGMVLQLYLRKDY